ncbi:hypothetical protein CPB84DRAFT_275514 [Gymnopilus junonius]|uniref:Uncharacterized protein n=1 Tax=Gymnopilus junonius TaxID=109634 RepID=A0A9P5NFC6_GYMJU|nr:hypothetical protein CPB84DRAFT_275514 [Gymnopilus junonius]
MDGCGRYGWLYRPAVPCSTRFWQQPRLGILRGLTNFFIGMFEANASHVLPYKTESSAPGRTLPIGRDFESHVCWYLVDPDNPPHNYRHSITHPECLNKLYNTFTSSVSYNSRRWLSLQNLPKFLICLQSQEMGLHLPSLPLAQKALCNMLRRKRNRGIAQPVRLPWCFPISLTSLNSGQLCPTSRPGSTP